MSGGFDLDWLRQREPFDLAARDSECAARFAVSLRGRASNRPLRILDLAAGTGSGFRALAPAITIDQDWTLADNDPALLQAQGSEIARWVAQGGAAATAKPWQATTDDGGVCVVAAEDARWRARPLHLDLQRGMHCVDLLAYDGIVTSAFLDLVSSAWLARFAHALGASRRPLLATLSVDGRRAWRPVLADDAAILRAFERHQARDKGFGPALGGVAAAHLAELLRQQGYTVVLARSDWRIGVDAKGILSPLLEDTLRAALETLPEQAATFIAWGDARRGQLEAGTLALDVGHLDLLALP